MVKGKGADALNQNLAILQRLMKASGAETDAALARILNIKPQNITGAKKTGIPLKWIVKISKDFLCDFNFLLHGEKDGTLVSESESAHVSKSEEGHGRTNLGEAVNLLAEIIQSGETPIIKALHSNLVAFRDAVHITGRQAELEAENKTLRQRVAHMKELIAQLEAQLQQDRITDLSRRLDSIERLYLDQAHQGNERRDIMVALGQILGYDGSIPINNVENTD